MEKCTVYSEVIYSDIFIKTKTNCMVLFTSFYYLKCWAELPLATQWNIASLRLAQIKYYVHGSLLESLISCLYEKYFMMRNCLLVEYGSKIFTLLFFMFKKDGGPLHKGEQLRNPRTWVLLRVKIQICLKDFNLAEPIWRGRAGGSCFKLETINSVHQGMDVFNSVTHPEKS